MKRVALIVLSLSVLLVGGLSFWFVVLVPPLCNNRVYEEVRSPDGQYRAILFQRACGATTGFSTHVSVVTAKENHGNDNGNVFVAEGAPHDGSWKIQWDDTEVLTISIDPHAETFLAETKIKGITIQYKPELR